MAWQPPERGTPEYLASVMRALHAQAADRAKDKLCVDCGHPLSLGRCTLEQCNYPAPSTPRDPRR